MADEQGKTPLRVAAEVGHKEVVTLLARCALGAAADAEDAEDAELSGGSGEEEEEDDIEVEEAESEGDEDEAAPAEAAGSSAGAAGAQPGGSVSAGVRVREQSVGERTIGRGRRLLQWPDDRAAL